jgi:hypothetical protein
LAWMLTVLALRPIPLLVLRFAIAADPSFPSLEMLARRYQYVVQRGAVSEGVQYTTLGPVQGTGICTFRAPIRSMASPSSFCRRIDIQSGAEKTNVIVQGWPRRDWEGMAGPVASVQVPRMSGRERRIRESRQMQEAHGRGRRDPRCLSPSSTSRSRRTNR